MSAGQKVIVDPDVEMDVVALAGTPDSVCAAVLRFRDGRLTDKREFFVPRYFGHCRRAGGISAPILSG